MRQPRRQATIAEARAFVDKAEVALRALKTDRPRVLQRFIAAVRALPLAGTPAVLPLSAFNGGGAGEANAAKRNVREVKGSLERYIDDRSGAVLSLTVPDRTADGVAGEVVELWWDYASFEAVEDPGVKSLIETLGPALRCVSLDGFPVAKGMPDARPSELIAQMAHLDGAIWRHRPAPSRHEHQVAIQKMVDAPDTYRWVTADTRHRARVDTSEVVHGYTSFWRAPINGARAIYLDTVETGNVRRYSDQRPWAGPHKFARPQLLDGFFSAVHLAPYLRSSKKNGAPERLWLLEAIAGVLWDDALRGLFYHEVYFRLTHRDEYLYFTDPNRFQDRCKWEFERGSRTEAIARLTLFPWKLEWDPSKSEVIAKSRDAATKPLGTLYREAEPSLTGYLQQVEPKPAEDSVARPPDASHD